MTEMNDRGLRRLGNAVLAVGAVSLTAAVALLAASLVLPPAAGDSPLEARAGRVAALPDSDCDPQPLLDRMAGNWLIKPPVVQAAVKDLGLADKLVKRLQLEGVVQSGPAHLAYIRVDKAAMKTVRQGEAVLEFTVTKIEPGRVTLTLEGVEVTLSH